MSNASDDRDKTIGEAVDEHAEILEKTFNLSPETAAVAAQNKMSKGMRAPGSDDVDKDREADARETEG
jgi:hypothetical protein